METKEKTFVRLGFNKKDTSELIDQVNILISSYHVQIEKIFAGNIPVKVP